ncbi:MAG TPA: hypothetical protein VHK28_07920 [Candidatus Limnocylindria bacterium]|nr:hypothetical protein [Candidatus Limnocylindria bacterium]
MPVHRSCFALPARLTLADAALAVFLLAGVGARVLPGLFTSFPMGDGGLFAVMAADIQAAGWQLPMFASYNGGEIPFTYPPVGLYVLAVLSAILGQTPVQVMDWWPPLLAVASMGAAWLLLSELTDRRTGAWATAVFAITPRSFEWLIVGGGVTRTLGFTMAILAIWLLVLGLREVPHPRGRLPFALGAGAVAGLTLLTHPEATSFGVVSLLALAVRERARIGQFLRVVLPAGAVAGAIVTPWLVVAIGRHGWQPYADALTSHNSGWVAVEHLLGLDTGAPVPVDPVKIAGAVGLVLLLVHRSWFIPAWYAGLMLLITGAGPTYAMLPLSIAAVLGVRWLAARVTAIWRLPLVAGGVAVAVLFAALAVQQPLSPTRQVSEEAREVMEWVRVNTPPDSRFALVSGTFWWADTEAEWFPALTGRVSVATVQGMEWLDEERWNGSLESHERLQSCAHAGLRCLADWARAYPAEVDYVWRRDLASLPLQDAVARYESGLIAAWERQGFVSASEGCAGGLSDERPPGPRALEACRLASRQLSAL